MLEGLVCTSWKAFLTSGSCSRGRGGDIKSTAKYYNSIQETIYAALGATIIKKLVSNHLHHGHELRVLQDS